MNDHYGNLPGGQRVYLGKGHSITQLCARDRCKFPEIYQVPGPALRLWNWRLPWVDEQEQLSCRLNGDARRSFVLQGAALCQELDAAFAVSLAHCLIIVESVQDRQATWSLLCNERLRSREQEIKECEVMGLQPFGYRVTALGLAAHGCMFVVECNYCLGRIYVQETDDLFWVIWQKMVQPEIIEAKTLQEDFESLGGFQSERAWQGCIPNEKSNNELKSAPETDDGEGQAEAK